MPRIRRRGVPRALLENLWLRVEEREISLLQLELFATWLETGPEVPSGRWFKRFPEMTVCGEDDLAERFCDSARSKKAKK